jgi:hypothetical protein
MRVAKISPRAGSPVQFLLSGPEIQTRCRRTSSTMGRGNGQRPPRHWLSVATAPAIPVSPDCAATADAPACALGNERERVALRPDDGHQDLQSRTEIVMRPTEYTPAILLSGLLLLVGCQSSQSSSAPSAGLLPPTTTEQKIDALRRYRTCLVNRAQLADDHKSDAMTIATSMRGSCKRELADMARSLAGGATADADWQIAASAERREVEAALNAVLTERKEQRPKR